MIYFDNAATTALHPEVKAAISEALDLYGNPSSTHETGRKSKIEIEKTRKLIAGHLKCEPGEIFFNGGGTEADNFALKCSVRDLGVKHIISTAIEHKAVADTIQFLVNRGEVRATLLPVNECGDIELSDLEAALQTDDKTLVSLMYANNEIGNINPMAEIVKMAKQHGALVHSDCVQAVGHVQFDLEQLPLDFIAFSAHKIHGPKGVGFCFVRGGLAVKPQIIGGGQERNMRAGTENVLGIIGLGKAFQLVTDNFKEESIYITQIKKYAIERLTATFNDLVFLGRSGDINKSLFTVLNIGFPNDGASALMTFSLDMKGFAVSGGSACNSGSNKGSHVIAALGETVAERVPVRISFSKFNTKAEIDQFVDALVEIRQPIKA